MSPGERVRQNEKRSAWRRERQTANLDGCLDFKQNGLGDEDFACAEDERLDVMLGGGYGLPGLGVANLQKTSDHLVDIEVRGHLADSKSGLLEKMDDKQEM
jgi:hypothetical protein